MDEDHRRPVAGNLVPDLHSVRAAVRHQGPQTFALRMAVGCSCQIKSTLLNPATLLGRGFTTSATAGQSDGIVTGASKTRLYPRRSVRCRPKRDVRTGSASPAAAFP